MQQYRQKREIPRFHSPKNTPVFMRRPEFIREELEEAEKNSADTFEKLRVQLSHPKVCALGEIGLDYHYDTDRDLQKKWFELQMKLASELNMPVQIHDREAHGDCMDIVRRFPEVRGVFHSFSGSAEMAKELAGRGWYISFSGVITFKNAVRMAEVVRAVPLDKILSETDSPYLAPHPFRGQINYSGYVRLTVERLPSLRVCLLMRCVRLHVIMPASFSELTRRFWNDCVFDCGKYAQTSYQLMARYFSLRVSRDIHRAGFCGRQSFV